MSSAFRKEVLLSEFVLQTGRATSRNGTANCDQCNPGTYSFKLLREAVLLSFRLLCRQRADDQLCQGCVMQCLSYNSCSVRAWTGKLSLLSSWSISFVVHNCSFL